MKNFFQKFGFTLFPVFGFYVIRSFLNLFQGEF
jgi:hypothetical protein